MNTGLTEMWAENEKDQHVVELRNDASGRIEGWNWVGGGGDAGKRNTLRSNNSQTSIWLKMLYLIFSNYSKDPIYLNGAGLVQKQFQHFPWDLASDFENFQKRESLEY